MAVRKSRSVKRTARPARSQPKKTARVKRAGAPQVERRHRAQETLRLRAIEPSLTVSDIEQSVRFYTNVLGFIEGDRWSENGVLRGVMLKAGLCQLGLSQDDWTKGRDRKKGEGVRIWCQTVQDIDALASRIRTAGGKLAEEPRDQSWGARSLAVDDPDGFHLTIYHERQRTS